MTSKWIPLESWKDLPEGTWLVKEDTDRPPYHIANVTSKTRDGHKMVIIGGHFHFDRRDPIAYTSFDMFEEDTL